MAHGVTSSQVMVESDLEQQARAPGGLNAAADMVLGGESQTAT
eukprot:COSAG01_NODE_533_length_15816_cov_4.518738_8_plen_43_part_00